MVLWRANLIHLGAHPGGDLASGQSSVSPLPWLKPRALEKGQTPAVSVGKPCTSVCVKYTGEPSERASELSPNARRDRRFRKVLPPTLCQQGSEEVRSRSEQRKVRSKTKKPEVRAVAAPASPPRCALPAAAGGPSGCLHQSFQTRLRKKARYQTPLRYSSVPSSEDDGYHLLTGSVCGPKIQQQGRRSDY